MESFCTFNTCTVILTGVILTDVILIQWKPLNVITLGQRESDNINRLITLTEQAFRLVDFKNAKWALDNFNLLITLTK